MDLSKLSDSDLQQIAKGDLRMVSTEGLKLISGENKSLGSEILDGAKNFGAGAVRGAGSIGSTILLPADMINQKLRGEDFFSMKDNNQRRSGIDAGLTSLVGSDPNSGLYKTGKIAAEIAGTSNMGGVIAKPLSNVAPRLANAISSGGFNLGSTGGNAVTNGLTRVAGGAINGAASAGAVSPESAGTGAIIGGATPVVVGGTGYAGNLINQGLNGVSHRLMQSALKPTIKQLKTGEAETAIKTLLDEGINPTYSGVDKLRSRIFDVNDEIANKIANSNATVDKQDILNTLTGVNGKFSQQVSPTKDLNAIQGVADDFINHPLYQNPAIPVQDAQLLKQGTYKVLKGKYGEVGSAETEAQKALARGLKEKIAAAVPDVQGLNARESNLLTTLGVAERRALMDSNKNTMGLAALANNPLSWAAFMADRSALAKSLAARGINGLSNITVNNPRAQGLLEQAAPRLFPILGAQGLL